jgi:signal transduction histidine kinase
LPFYGNTANDWLRVETDHAHRNFESKLLPKNLQKLYQQTERLRFLPTLRRVLGVVEVNTSVEPSLEISITRDRLVPSTAYLDLVDILRYAFDFYAYEAALAHFEKKQRMGLVEPVSVKFERIEDVLEDYKGAIPERAYNQLYTGIREATVSYKTEQDELLEKLTLLGPLATAGISALAYQHELRKQFKYVEDLVRRMRQLHAKSGELKSNLASLADDLEGWLKRARNTNALFDYMANSENVQERNEYRIKPTIEEVLRQLTFFSRGIDINLSGVDPQAYLPKASYAEWGAIFQNIFTNAFNAMQDTNKRMLKVNFEIEKSVNTLLIQDTGRGVDLRNSENLFEPFRRQGKISKERMELGYGGSGLGLTIVRLLGEKIGCKVKFTKPENDFNTAFSIQWERK